MPEFAGFHFRVEAPLSDTHMSVVLLHGSGRNEDDLLLFGSSVFPKAALFFPRGKLNWENGYAFFRRKPDRQLDLDDLARQAESLCLFLEFVERETGQKPILAGYSNGAIIAAETILQNHALSKRAILLRPLSPRPDEAFPPMTGYPALLIAAENDQRRNCTDAPYLAGQFAKAGASITLKTVAGGHGWAEGDADIQICKRWLGDHCDG